MDPNQQPQNVNNPAQPEQPQVVTQPPNPGYQQAAPVAENPGQALGIISIILSFVGFSLIGLILGAISRNKSKAVGAPTTLGTVGLVLGIVFTAISIFFFILMSLAAYAGIQERARDEASRSQSRSSSIYDRPSSNYDSRL